MEARRSLYQRVHDISHRCLQFIKQYGYLKPPLVVSERVTTEVNELISDIGHSNNTDELRELEAVFSKIANPFIFNALSTAAIGDKCYNKLPYVAASSVVGWL